MTNRIHLISEMTTAHPPKMERPLFTRLPHKSKNDEMGDEMMGDES